MQNYIGQHIERYRITERLGEGGMAVVYKAYDIRLERNVALKLIRTEAIPQEQHERLMQRFEREAKAQAGFSHPNIVPVYDYGVEQGLPYLVMEYITGGTLKERLTGSRPNQQALRWLIPIASALSYAHKVGVVHWDVKPSNILFDQEGRPILTDFGIAKILETSDISLTGTGLGVGTPEYMAPEQWQGQASAASDQYALGIVLYELLTGKKPFTAETPLAVALKQMNEPLPRPRDLVESIPEQVEKLLYKALAPNPEDRFENMSVFLTELEYLLQKMVSAKAVQRPFSALVNSDIEPFAFRQEAEYEDQLSENHEHPGRTTPPSSPNDRSKTSRKGLSYWLMWVSIGAALVSLVCLGAVLFLSNMDLNGLRMQSVDNMVETITQETKMSGAMDNSQTNFEMTAPSHTPSPEPSLTPIPIFTPTITPTLGIGSSYLRDVDGMVMMFVPAGNFLMGSDHNDPDAFAHEKPQREVYLDAFWMDAYEVSNALYAQFVSQTGYRTLAERQGHSYKYDASWNWIPAPGIYWRNPMGDGHFPDDGLPVVHVSFEDASAYCNWAGGRLPTEAEWEKAARGVNGLRYPWGNEFNSEYLRFHASTGPVSVDQFPQGVSPYGIYNMAGNAFEWTNDWYRVDYYSISPRENPSGPPTGELRVMRGGSWHNSRRNVRTTHRDTSLPEYMNALLGFRCVRDIE